MKDLLADNTFIIPSYQRLYSWGAHEADDLMNDILNVAAGHEQLHFFGNIITIGDHEYNDLSESLIDGQQRITTSMALLAIIRDLSTSLINEMPSNQRSINNKTAQCLQMIKTESNNILFGNSHKHSNRFLSLHVQNVSDNNQQNYKKFFNGMIIDDRSHSYTKYLNRNYEPIRLLNIVHKNLRERMHIAIDSLVNVKQKAHRLDQIFQAFIYHFYVITMTANSRSEALTIYMTLNTRGKELSVPDIIKANLAGVANQSHYDVQRVMHKWDIMTSSLNNDSDTITNFLKLYWIAVCKKISTRELPRYIVNDVNTVEKVDQMITNLIQLTPVYQKLINPEYVHVDKLDNLSFKIDMLNQMGMQYYYSVILAMYHRGYNQKEINQAFNIIVKIEMREAINQGSHPGYQLPAHYIWIYPRNIDKAIDELKSKLDSSHSTYAICNTYHRAIAKSGTGKNFNLMAYLIATSYYYKNHDFDSENAIYNNLFLHHNYSLIHIDHQNRNYINYLGNCVLIEKDIERNLSDNGINSLLEALGKSSLKSNQLLINKIARNVDHLDDLILQRQKSLAKMFINVW